MRTAQQLIDAATATGTYANYNGDGASVPWDEVIPPPQTILYFYKLYLDRRWPEAFKLHDWCYTPLGSLIQVTREEADLALYEIIARDSIPDAVIVYTAVRLGGGQYFGISTTGFTGWSRQNRGGTSPERTTMPTKCVLILKDATVGQNIAQSRNAGNTESVWHPSDDLDTVSQALFQGVQQLFGLVPARAALLPAQSGVLGVKLYKGGAGKGSTLKRFYPGNSQWPTDIPHMALNLNARSQTTGQVRKWALHYIPDQFVVTGEFAPSTAYNSALINYFFALTQFGFYSKPQTETGFHITTIVQVPPVAPATVATALVTTFEPHTFSPGDQATVYSTKLPNGDKLTITKRVQTVPSATQLTFGTWNAGNTTDGIVGSPLKVLDQFNQNNFGTGTITTRKPGNPSDRFRGRRSKKRKTA